MRPVVGLALILAVFALACEKPAALSVAIDITPVENGRVSGAVTLEAKTQPATGIEEVEFIVEARSVGVAKAQPFSVKWDSSPFTGHHVSVTARAKTSSGGLALSDPIRVAVDPPHVPLPLGRESIYALVNSGNLTVANELLQDIWDLGPRSTPVYMNPISWPENTKDYPYNDPYWRLLFYSLRPTVNLLWAYYTVGDTRYLEKLVEILRSYCAYDLGPPERPLEPKTLDERYSASFRAMVLVNTYAKLKRSHDLPLDLDASLLQSIQKLGGSLYLPGGFSSNFGNHGFTTAAALLLIATNFPDLDTTRPGESTWLDTSFLRLNQLMEYAVDRDGVEVENSPFYHLYVMTFAQEITTWGRTWAIPLPTNFENTSDLMSDYGAYILQPDGRVPLLGSSVTMSLANLDPTLEAEVVARDSTFAYVASQGASGVEPTEWSRLYPQSGQSILRSGFGPPDEFSQQTFMTFNVGPWRSAHNHLDVLGLTYYSAGQVLLPDSGLFTYDDTVLRPEHDYFFGTRAHNTVVVDGNDQTQSQSVGAGLTASGDKWAYQSGSEGLNPGVAHRRGVLLLQRDLALVVDQLVADLGLPHDYVQTWHFAPGLTVTKTGPADLDADATDSAGTPVVSLAQGVLTNLSSDPVTGQTDPLQGWFSEKYGVKVPNTVLEYAEHGGAASFVTLIASGPFAGTQPQATVDQDDSSVVRVRVCAGGVQYQVEIDNLSNGTAAGVPAESVQVTSITTGCN